MNRLILKYGTPLTVVILAVFAWVVSRRIADGGPAAILVLAVTAIVVWMLGAGAFIVLWPRITVGGFKRAIVRHGLGGGPVPVNTLYAVPGRPSGPTSAGGLLATGADDLLYVGGWLDVSGGPRVLQVPAMDGRYYSLQFTDPVDGANFAYVGERTTGTAAGVYLLCAPGWAGDVPAGMTRIDIPHRRALLIGRVLVADEGDRPAALALAQRLRLTPVDSAGASPGDSTD